MDILNNSIVDSVIEYANVKFGVELDKDAITANIKQLNYSEVLNLVDAIKQENDDTFIEYIDLNAVNEGYSILPPIDRDKYQERDGLEGPIQTKAGKVVYYDAKEGSYYDPDTDMYMSYEDFKELDEGFMDTVKNVANTVATKVKNFVTPGSVKVARQKGIGNQGSIAKQINMKGFKEAITPTVAQGPMSAASIRKDRNGNDQRDAVIQNQDANRDATAAQRFTAGAARKVATGQGAARYDKRQDPDDVQRGQNAQAAGQAQQMASNNSAEIERLKQLIQGRR
tara:strand:+ start:14943 stop:15791 length:849 start_codon:yes stop_codon:yes gene_type:complete